MDSILKNQFGSHCVYGFRRTRFNILESQVLRWRVFSAGIWEKQTEFANICVFLTFLLDNCSLILYINSQEMTFSSAVGIKELKNMIKLISNIALSDSHSTAKIREDLPMKKQLLFTFIPLLAVYTIFPAVTMADQHDVVINEVAWMGTEASTADEFIELYNDTGADIDLDGWTLSAADGDPSVILTGSIPAGGYFLMERTDDNTVSDVSADQIYSGSLGNTGENLVLRDQGGAEIDRVDCSGGWFAGTTAPKATMERLFARVNGSREDVWETNNGVTCHGTDAAGNPIMGTPGSENSVRDASLSVTMNAFYAYVSGGQVILRWRTESELGCLGFHVLRGEDSEGPYEPVTTEPIPARGNVSSGADYQYTDPTAGHGHGYWYKLKELSASGRVHVFGPVYAFPGKGAELPDDFRLGVYPNPFNPCTTIHYTISPEGTGRATVLRVVDMLGREVVRLVDRNRTAGEYVAVWNGKDGSGRDAASGVYLVQLLSGGQPVEACRLLKLE
jgi:hypothetical protein